jgi:hypothetical protein
VVIPRKPFGALNQLKFKVMQKKIKKQEEEQKPVNLDAQKKEFEDLKSKKIAKATRIVRLFHHCNGHEFTLEVPIDSTLRDGDMTSDYRFPGEKLTGRSMYGGLGQRGYNPNRYHAPDAISRDLDKLKKG